MKRFSVIGFMMVFAAVSLQAANENWMAGLPDSMPVCRVSIPGTHDSGTAGVRFPMRHYARTQTMNLSEQWDAGIRFFDLRPKLDGDELKIYHGPANCHLTLEEALTILIDKLELNPTEFCIIMTNSAGGGQKAVNMTMDLISAVVPSKMLAYFRPDLTVADIRGRMLFMHRNAPSAGIDYPGVVTRGWPGNGMSRQARIVSSEGVGATLWAQDFFTNGSRDGESYLKSKWDNMYRLMRALYGADDKVWCINHASGYTGTGVSTNIRRNAQTINKHLLDYLLENRSTVGIIPMDFPSQELIDAIVDCNK